MSRSCSLLVFASVSILLVACGSSDQSLFEGDGTKKSGTGNGDDGAPPGDLGSFSSDPVGTNAACVTSSKNATLPAVNLIMMYDKSGSMGDPAEGGDPNVKWIPVNTGMKAFFSDPASGAYNASLQFFPAPGDLNATCNFSYANAKVPLTSLSKSALLISALDAATPQGGTPTLPALTGAISYAKEIAARSPEEKTVVVLVTDGEPGLQVNWQFQAGCANNDIQHVADLAKAGVTGSPSIPTYVIGVGPALDKLNQIASSGGTGQAFMISTANPTQTKTDLQKALEAIRGQVKIGCDFGIPAPPAGQTLDKERVNVGYTNGAGQETPLVYSGDCASGAGWRYDNLAAPTRIELCPATCSTGQSDPNGKLTIAFGCITNGLQK